MNPKANPETVHRILVIKLSSLGDLFHSLPTVHALKTGFGAEIDWVVHDEYTDVVRCFTDVSRVIGYPRHSFLRGFAAFGAELRRDRYDLIVDLQGLLKSALTACLARGGARIGPSFHREGSGFLYSETATGKRGIRHAVDRNLDTVRHLGLPCGSPVFPVRFPEIELAGRSPRVAVIPVSRWRSKNWGVGRFAYVARHLRDEVGATVYLMGGKRDVAVCESIRTAAGSRNVEISAGRCSLVETGSMLSRMDLVISNDSGPAHMAAAAGARTLVLFGPTDPRLIGPYGDGHRVITVPVPCGPCRRRRCYRPRTRCMVRIHPEDVTRAAFEMLREAGFGTAGVTGTDKAPS